MGPSHGLGPYPIFDNGKMSMGIEKNRINDLKSGESDHEAYERVEKHIPYIRTLMFGDYGYAEDLSQEIQIKFFERFKKDSDWWNHIDRKNAFIRQSARNLAFNLRRKMPSDLISIDDESNIHLRDSLSDEGASCSQMNENIDYESYRAQIKEILTEEFSGYEQKLVQLNFFERCKPTHIAEILMQEYPDVLEKEYPGVKKQSPQHIQSLRMFIQVDCNRLNAKFLQRLKRRIKDGPKRL